MRTLLRFFILASLCANLAIAADEKPIPRSAILHTSKGDITIKLFPNEAPISVSNFIGYVESGFYNDTIFHRVVKRFAIQGGGFTKDLVKKATKDPIVNESGNGLHNDRWTVAMARTDDPNSASSQFYINLRMNSSLDKRGKKAGYAVFGEVTDGFHVVQSIGKQQTRKTGSFANLPIKPIILNSVEIK